MAFIPSKQKGQGVVEYLLLIFLFLILVVALMVLIQPVTQRIEEVFGVIPLVNTTHALVPLLPIILPVMLAVLTSLYDGTLVSKKNVLFLKPGRLEAKICFSLLTFDIWALTTVVSNPDLVPPSPVTRTDLAIFLIILIFIHLAGQYACTHLLTGDRHKFFRFLLVLISINIPLTLVYPTNLLLR